MQKIKKIMKLKQIFKIYKRLLELGPSGIFYRLKNRAQKKLFALKFKKNALKKKTNYSWQQIAKKHKQTTDFSIFLKTLKELPLIPQYNPRALNPDPYLEINFPFVIQKADLFTNNCFEIFGQTISFPEKIDWQNDWKTEQQAKTWGKQLLYFSDIKIETSQQKPSKYYSDIKVPWELSRFQHIYFLGQAYNLSSTPKYAKTFQNHVESWIVDNPYLLGVNWVCPMEVAIRAVNFIWGFHFFKNYPLISQKFWLKFICSLYDHLIYLENNWEESDKPNNHYLSDLLGYFYLTLFFQKFKNFKKKQRWVVQKLLDQFDQQIQNDGTSYEGSTNYHRLVTEIFWHFKLLCESQKILLPQNFDEKFNRMLLFLQDCTDSDGNLVQIGDNDSGKITFLSIPPCPKPYRKSRGPDQTKLLSHYPNFGLTIIKTANWHITFRHPTFNKNQPSGHFHQDELAITLSINGIPILVDPGTYLYTANKFWRNFFRSKENHNSFYMNATPKQQDLFQSPRVIQQDTAKIQEKSNQIIISNYHKKKFRTIIFDSQKETVIIEDSIKLNKNLSNKVASWNFIFHPAIKLYQISDRKWLVKKNDSEIAQIATNLNFEKVNGFYSKEYGVREKCSKLKFRQNNPFKKVQVTFQRN